MEMKERGEKQNNHKFIQQNTNKQAVVCGNNMFLEYVGLG